MEKNLLIVVDMQNDFVTGALGSKEAQAIVKNVRDRILKSNKEDELISFTRDTHETDYMETEEGKHLPVPHCIRNTDGWQICKDIPIPERSHMFNKNTFGSSNLSTYLSMFNDSLKRIELIGLCTDICVLANVVIAKTACPNAHVVVDAACCAGVSPELHDNALNAMRSLQVEVINQGLEPWRKE